MSERPGNSRILLSRLRGPACSLVDLAFPPECLVCGASTRGEQRVTLCEACCGDLQSNYYRCRKCATPLPKVVPNRDCFRCRQANWKFDRVITLGPYRERLREIVIRMKKPSEGLLRRAMGGLLVERWQEEFVGLERSAIVIPVPNHWTHTWLGAADVAGDLACVICRQLDFPLKNGIVRRIRKTAKQGMLTWSERSQNVRGAFEIRHARELTGRHVILVDDVLTSAATCAEIARRLKRAGIDEVSILVAARGTGVKESPSPNQCGS